MEDPEKKEIEITSADEQPPETPSNFSARAGGKAEVNVRLLTQEEFDRLQKEKAEREIKGE